eukprot:6769175-Prymnesium_polylepis.1
MASSSSSKTLAVSGTLSASPRAAVESNTSTPLASSSSSSALHPPPSDSDPGTRLVLGRRSNRAPLRTRAVDALHRANLVQHLADCLL